MNNLINFSDFVKKDIEIKRRIMSIEHQAENTQRMILARRNSKKVDEKQQGIQVEDDCYIL